jgi:thiol:disulfide interchange protein
MLVLFTSEWCGACKTLKRQTLTNKKVIFILQKFVLVELDIDHLKRGPVNREIMERLVKKHNWIPVVLLVTPWESYISEAVGAVSSSEFLEFLSAGLATWHMMPH